MTSSEERREVAEMLRGLRYRTYYNEEVVENIKDAIGIADPVNTFREPEDVYECLADLIDPTCEVESVDSTAGLPAYNLSCGDTVFVHLNELIPLYCPYCGARLLLEHEFVPRFPAKEVHE